MARLPFIAVPAAQPNLPPVFFSRGASSQGQVSEGSPAAPIIRGASTQPQKSTGSVPSLGVSTQPQASTGTVVSVVSFGVSTQPQASAGVPASTTFANGFANQYELRVAAWPGATGTNGNFLLPFVETRTEFKSTANGGLVESSTGRDIRFEVQTSSGAVKLGHKLIFYGPTTGTIVALVNMPRDFTKAESFLLYTGKAGLSVSEEDVTLARAGGWLAWYSGNNGTDLTGQGRDLTPTSSPPATTLGDWPAADVDGVADCFVGSGAASWLNGLANLSWVSFHEADSTSTKNEIFNVATSTQGELSLHFNDTTDNRLTAVAKYGTSVLQYQSANNRQSVDPQAVAVRWQAGAAVRMSINGAGDVAASAPSNPTGTTSISDNLEWGRGDRSAASTTYFDGKLAFLGFLEGALSNASMDSMTAAFIDPRQVYGLGERNRVSDTNKSPVALPIRDTASAGTAKTLNVATLGGYDPESGTLTCSAASIVSGSGTVTRSGASITVTPAAATAQTLVVSYTLSDGTKTSTGRVYLTVSATTGGVTHAQILANPFNKLSAVHTPLGRDVRLGIPEYTLDPMVPNPTYVAGNLGARGRLALVKVGGLRLGSTEQGVKRRFLITTNDTDFPERVVEWYGPRRDGTGKLIPLGTGDGIDPPFYQRMPPDPTPWTSKGTIYSHDVGGDNEVTFFPGDGVYNDPLTDLCNTYNKFDYKSVFQNPPNPDGVGNRHKAPYPTDNAKWASARARDSNPLGGLDVRNRYNDPGSWGPGAIDWRHPAGFLQGDEVVALAVYHLLNATVCRHSNAANNPAPPSAHIPNFGMTYPAWNTDRPQKSDENKGDIPYGTRMTITTTKYNEVMALTTLSPEGKAVIEAIYSFGILVCDGQGQYVNGGPAVQLRTDIGFLNIAGLEAKVKKALDTVAEHLWPVYDTRRHNGDYPSSWVHTDGFVYIGGGGPRSVGAVNNALV